METMTDKLSQSIVSFMVITKTLIISITINTILFSQQSMVSVTKYYVTASMYIHARQVIHSLPLRAYIYGV